MMFLSCSFIARSLFSQELKYEFLFELKATLDAPILVGKTPLGTRGIYPVKDGTFDGPDLKGKVLANGGDWALTLDSNTTKLDVRAVLKTHDDEIIYTSYTGYIYKNPDNTFYFRTNPIFETSSKKYSYLNHTIAVGVGRFIEGGVAYYVYAIK